LGTLIALDIALDDLDVVADRVDVRSASGGEVVEHADVMTVGDKPSGEVRADESAPAGDERSHAVSLS